ncbi:TauD/TfdA family dioxygenase [Roseibium sp. HPY-6]|uniref:TauD/TfdA family dioxygenase n=1 Tax=Roseibium sp. HPY-6 TaxID=3229852 RepID=UPI00338EBFB8
MLKRQNACKIEALSFTADRLTVTWGDGHQSVFPSIWLLHACDNPICGSSETGVRLVKLTDQPARPQILAARSQDGEAIVEWGKGHVSRFAPVWLRGHCLSNAERLRRQPAAEPWGTEMKDRLTYLSYGDVSADADTHLTFLEALRDDGVVILQDVPVARERTEEIAGLVGKLHLTNYGIFELEAKPTPEIVGDMAVALELHTDEPYRIEVPSITFFHVLKQSDAGGESTMADGLWLAARMAEKHPEEFEILKTVNARHHRILKEGRVFDVQAPIFPTDVYSRVSGIRINDRGMAPVDCPLGQVEPFYDALRILLEMIYSGEGRVTTKLKEGEMMVFNNQRLLHGRERFDPARSHRHVRSCHVDLDEFHSRLRVAYRLRDDWNAWRTMTTMAHT